MSKHTFRILNNGREVENIHADEYPTMEEAFCAGVNAVDDLCPRMSPNRHFYSVETIQIEDNKIDHNLISAATDLLAACKAALELVDGSDPGAACDTREEAEAARCRWRESIEQSIRAAITKAEGESK